MHNLPQATVNARNKVRQAIARLEPIFQPMRLLRKRQSPPKTLVARTLKLAALRIALVSLIAGAISYGINQSSLEEDVRQQLLLSTEQTLQRESLPFREIKDLQRNFLDEFARAYANPQMRKSLEADFDLFFYRHEDGSYTQRPGLFEGNALSDGRSFPNMSATYAPDVPPDADIKTRFMLAYLLANKYGSGARGRLFNFYGVLPEKGFPNYQSADIAQAFTYTGENPLRLETYEFYYRGFASPTNETLYTRMYFDYSNNAWMTTVATPDAPDANGKHKILACVDVLLDDLMQRTAKPTLMGSYSTIFLADADGTLIFHPDHLDTIKKTEGMASIRGLRLEKDYALLKASRNLDSGKVMLLKTPTETIALGIIPETPWVLSVHYPHALMRPAILQNLALVIALGLATLVVEIFIIRSILQEQVAKPLTRLMQAMREVGTSGKRPDRHKLPTESQDEIGELAREFAGMSERVHDTHEALEHKVKERTAALEEANAQLITMSTTDELTGAANRRKFDETLQAEWNRALRDDAPLSLIMVDVDWFKHYTDYYGHQAGDACLRKIAQLLISAFKRGGDLVARYGGEEFAVIMPSTSHENAMHMAQSLCQVITEANMSHYHSPIGIVSISVGVSTAIPHANIELEDLLREADLALYRAKELGRNRAETIRPKPIMV